MCFTRVAFLARKAVDASVAQTLTLKDVAQSRERRGSTTGNRRTVRRSSASLSAGLDLALNATNRSVPDASRLFLGRCVVCTARSCATIESRSRLSSRNRPHEAYGRDNGPGFPGDS